MFNKFYTKSVTLRIRPLPNKGCHIMHEGNADLISSILKISLNKLFTLLVSFFPTISLIGKMLSNY